MHDALRRRQGQPQQAPRRPQVGAGRKGDRPLLCEAPEGPFRQKGPVPFSTGSRPRLVQLPPSRFMALTKISNGTVYDPANNVNGVVTDLWIQDGKIVAPPADPGVRPDKTLHAAGHDHQAG